jgi:hypothetical protein
LLNECTLIHLIRLFHKLLRVCIRWIPDTIHRNTNTLRQWATQRLRLILLLIQFPLLQFMIPPGLVLPYIIPHNNLDQNPGGLRLRDPTSAWLPCVRYEDTIRLSESSLLEVISCWIALVLLGCFRPYRVKTERNSRICDTPLPPVIHLNLQRTIHCVKPCWVDRLSCSSPLQCIT